MPTCPMKPLLISCIDCPKTEAEQINCCIETSFKVSEKMFKIAMNATLLLSAAELETCEVEIDGDE